MSSPKTEITGRGIVSALGSTVTAFEEALLSGACGIGDVTDLVPGLKFTNGAPVRDFDPSAHFDVKTQGHLDRYTQMAAVAARQAWAEAGLDATPPVPARVAVVVGTANTGIDATGNAFRKVFVEGQKLSPFTIPQIMGSAPASRIARELGAKGPVFGVTSACASAGHAMLVGEGLIRAGIVDVAVVGGADSCFEFGLLKAWEALRVVSTDTCRPFSIGRKGLIMGEGAGIVILERAGRAAARGAHVFGRWLGAGMSSDAGDIVAPDPEGMKAAMRAALADADLPASAVGWVNAHGTGTTFNDKCESAAVLDVFGPDAPPISAVKSQVGHAMGAAGAIEVIATLAGLNRGILPPTLGFLGPDPECPVDAVTDGPRAVQVEVAIKNSFAFGGLNLSIILGRGD